MSRSHIQILIASIVLSLANPAVRAAEFAGGAGTADDPYRIATAEQLISIGSDPNLLDKHFAMVNDIDLDPNLSPDYVFDRAVIAAEKPWFTGVFDGNGFRIRHLTMRGNTAGGYQLLGLFGRIWRGEVKRLILEEVDIASSPDWQWSDIGAICGSHEGIISRCSVTGSVSGDYTAGGLVGVVSRGIVEQCRSICTVSAKYSGGLAGANQGEIRYCYTAGHVIGEIAGGLAASGTKGLIHHSYAACRVDGTGPSSGGLVGYINPLAGAARDCYFLALQDGGGPDNGIGTALTSEQMRQPLSFGGWDFGGLDNDGFRIPWYMPEDGYPQLAWLALEAMPQVRGWTFDEAYEMIERAGTKVSEILYDFDPVTEWGCVSMTYPQADVPPGTGGAVVLSLGPYDWSANPGTGDANDPYLVFSPGQLDCLAYQPQLWDKCFRLVSDLDMTWRVQRRPLLGCPGANRLAFEGVFDGNGHIIHNLTIEGGSVDDAGAQVSGFFGEIGPSGSVKDLGLVGVSIKRLHQQAIAGMLCAVNGGYIARCYSVGALQGYGQLGGLVGDNAGVIEDCYAAGKIEDLPFHYYEGLYGGLVASHTTGMIRTCYATCTVPLWRGAGLVAHNESGSIEHSLWDVDASGVTASDGGTGVSTQELMDVQVLQRNGWGGNLGWILDNGKDYPRLVWEGTPGGLIPVPEPGPHGRWYSSLDAR